VQLLFCSTLVVFARRRFEECEKARQLCVCSGSHDRVLYCTVQFRILSCSNSNIQHLASSVPFSVSVSVRLTSVSSV
jgi:hypothetical protein